MILFVVWLLTFGVQAIDGGFVPQVYFFILLVEVAYKKKKSFSIFFTILCYFGFVFGVYIQYGRPPFEEIGFVIPRALEYLLIHGFSTVTRKADMQKEQLNHAYTRLQEINQQLEEKVLLEERMRLSREIHDVIGHTLTTALIGMEAGKQLILHNKLTEAVDKLDQVKEQVKLSQDNVRKSIHTLYTQQQTLMDLYKSIQALIENTRKQTEIDIQAEIGELPPLSDQQKLTLYRALQEGLTNGIRHGNSTSFRFKLKVEQQCIHFCLEDNGIMSEHWKFGFGLTSMNERVRTLGGVLKVDKSQKGGCKLVIELPLIHNKEVRGVYHDKAASRYYR